MLCSAFASVVFVFLRFVVFDATTCWRKKIYTSLTECLLDRIQIDLGLDSGEHIEP